MYSATASAAHCARSKQKLAALAEDSAEEARHGEDDVTMRDWLEHFLL